MKEVLGRNHRLIPVVFAGHGTEWHVDGPFLCNWQTMIRICLFREKRGEASATERFNSDLGRALLLGDRGFFGGGNGIEKTGELLDVGYFERVVNPVAHS